MVLGYAPGIPFLKEKEPDHVFDQEANSCLPLHYATLASERQQHGQETVLLAVQHCHQEDIAARRQCFCAHFYTAAAF